MARTAVLGACLGMISLLAFLTLRVATQHGIDVLVVVSFVILALLAFGVLGALTTPPDE
jgi:hypothetical protein